ncbi:MAG: hypothetical protein ABI051_17915 [Vicinamibacterales bacterium]
MRSSVLAVLMCLVSAVAAHAQRPGPISPFVVDLRGFYSGLGQDPTTAKDLELEPIRLPKRGLGALAGLHVYPLRTRTFALGIGGEGMLVRGRFQLKDTEGKPVDLPAQQRVKSLTGQLSINFGSHDGWSYLTAGMGPMILKTYVGETAPLDPAPSKMTINMGGGARWFASQHLAFTFDVRFYQTRPEVLTPPYPSRQRMRLLILSAGISAR